MVFAPEGIWGWRRRRRQRQRFGDNA
jgi:hypothetical protein